MTNHLPEQPRADDSFDPLASAPADPPAEPQTPPATAGDPAVTPVAAGGTAAGSASPTLAEALAAPVDAPEPVTETPGRLEITGEWRRVSPKAVTIELLTNAVVIVVVVVAAAIGASLLEQTWPWFIGGAVVAVTLVTLAFVPRRIRSIGYRLREDDLLFRRGIMWQRFVAVPYGRMQLVDINRGPLARAFGLAELKFVTASPATGVTIPGLPLDEAEGLRDHLVAVAESRRTGL